MKVLMVITGLGMGGAEHVVVNLADEFAKLGHKVKLAYLNGEIEVEVSPKNPDVELISIGMKSSKDFAKAFIKLRKIVKEFKPDVVHSHMFHSNIISRLLRLTISVPKVISSSHNTNEGGGVRMLAYRLTDKLADISTNVSQEAVDTLVKKGAVRSGRMISVVNGIDTKYFYFDKDIRKKKRTELNIANQKMILAVGRLNPQKDYRNLLNSVYLLKKQRQDFKLFIAGDGALREELMLLVQKLEITEFIEFLGIRRDIPSLMSASDIFVLSSSWEGFGLVVAEAMACERVVVATDCGGVSEVVGPNGFLTKPRNSNLLAQTIDKALDLNDDQRYSLGIAARKRIIDNYSLSANIEAYLKLYN